MDTFLPDDSHAVLQSIHSIGDFGKVIDAHGLLLGGEGAVVRAGALEISTGQQLNIIVIIFRKISLGPLITYGNLEIWSILAGESPRLFRCLKKS